MMDLISILSLTATVSTLGLFATGIPICVSITRRRRTEGVSSLPFVVASFGCSLWLMYGLLVGDVTMVFVNLCGLLAQSSYVIVFYCYCSSPGTLSAVRRQIGTVMVLIGTAYWYLYLYETDVPLAQYRLGFVGAAANILFTAAPLSALGEVFSTGSTEMLPFPMVLANFFVSLQWSGYGYLIRDNFVVVPNLVSFGISAFQLALFLILPSKSKRHAL